MLIVLLSNGNSRKVESFNKEDYWNCSEHGRRCSLDVVQSVAETFPDSCRGRNDVKAADRKHSPFVIKNAKLRAQNSREAKTEVLATVRSVKERI